MKLRCHRGLLALATLVACVTSSSAQGPPPGPLEAPTPAAQPTPPATKSPLGEKQPADADDAAKLILQLSDKDKLTAQAAARALGKIGVATIPPLAVAVKKQPAAAPHVAQAFTEMGAEAIPALLDAIRRDKDERLRQAVARGLGGMGPAATGPLAAAAKDPDVYVRLTALEALDHLTLQPELPVPDRVVAVLLESLSDKVQSHRQLAAQALARLGPKNEQVVPALLRSLKEDEDARVRRTAATGLTTVIRRGHCTEAMVDGLAVAVTADDEPATRAAAAAAVGFAHKHADKAATTLAAALKDRYGAVRQAAAQGLLQLGGDAKPAAAALIAALESDTFPKVAWYAAGALGEIGPAAVEAAPALTKALGDKDGNIRVTAADALGKIGPAAAKAAPALLAALGDKSPLMRETAARSLVKIGAPADELIPALKQLLEDESPRVRATAKELLASPAGAKKNPKPEPK